MDSTLMLCFTGAIFDCIVVLSFLVGFGCLFGCSAAFFSLSIVILEKVPVHLVFKVQNLVELLGRDDSA